MKGHVDILASYVPPYFVRRVLAAPGAPLVPMSEQISGAILFMDVTGFAALADSLAALGPAGAEILTRRLNNYFGALIEVIAGHGGEVLKFAGDAMLALWPASERDEHELSLATRRAACCALEAQVVLKDLIPDADPHGPASTMQLRIGLGAGDVTLALLGGLFDRWETLVGGGAVTSAARSEGKARPGEVVVSADAWALLADRCNGDPVDPGGNYQRLRRVLEPLAPVAARSPTLSEAAAQGLRGFIPQAVTSRVEAGQTAWLAELRRLTVLFVHLPGLANTTEMEDAQSLVRELQRVIHVYEGSLNKLSVDEKGVTLLAAFGLPPHAHEDDPARGVQAALDFQKVMTARKLACAIGVGTGHAFCGSVGNERRREYTVIGDTVNLAARLMQAAPGAEVLCDGATANASASRVRFEALQPIHVKGKVEPVAISRPISRREVPLGVSVGSIDDSGAFIGRVEELAVLDRRLDGLTQNRSGLVVLEGGAGIGKSRLVRRVVERAAARGIVCWSGAGDAIERTTPFHAWRSILSQILEVPPGLDSVEFRRAHVCARLAAIGEEGRAPLLSPMLALDMGDTELTAQMSGQLRAENTRALMLHILQAAAAAAPLLLVIEDAHWLDSGSWALLSSAHREIDPLLLIVATRPLDSVKDEFAQTAYEQLLAVAGQRPDELDRIELAALAARESESLVCAHLGVKSIPAPVSALILGKAEGNPFFTVELALALRDAGLITLSDGECRLSLGADLATAAFPDTVHGVVTSRIDRLAPSQQLVLKVASVVGRAFAVGALRAAHPIDADQARLTEYVEAIERLGHWAENHQIDARRADLLYVFSHVITQEVAYSLLPFEQRKQLHMAVARWLEGAFQDDLSPHYAILAHHWSRASAPNHAVPYLEKVGEQSLGAGAYREAIGFFGQALAILPQAPDLDVPVRRARCERGLADAHYGLGQITASRHHATRTLEHLGVSVPKGQWQLAIALVGQILGQVLRPLRRHSKPPARDVDALLEAARGYGTLWNIDYQTGQAVSSVHAAIRTLNLAERVGPSAELAEAHGTMCLITGVIPMHRLAEHYGRQSLATVDRLSSIPNLAVVLELIVVYSVGVGNWSRADELVTRAIEINTRIGDRRRLDECLALRSWLPYLHGGFTESAQWWRRTAASAATRGDPQPQIWGLCGQVECALPTGLLSIAESLTLLAEARKLLSGTIDADEIRVHGLLSKVHLLGGDQQSALEAARAAATHILASSPTAFYSFEGRTSVAAMPIG